MRSFKTTGWLLVMASACALTGWAQTPEVKPSIPQENSPTVSGQQSGLNPDYGLPMNPDQPVVREAGRAAPLPSVLGRLHWSSIYLRSVDFFQVFGPSNSFTAGGGSEWKPVASELQGTFAFAKQFRHTQIALQYRPNVLFANGNAYDNHDLRFDTSYNHPINPRWSMNVYEGLDYRSLRNQYADSYLTGYAVTGIVVQNNFLEGPSESLYSSTSLLLSHGFSPRTHLSFGPQFFYAYTPSGSQQNLPVSSKTYGGVASLDHALSPNRNVGLYYLLQRITISRTFANTTYHTLGASYSQQLAPSWRVGFSAGVSTSDYTGTVGRQWTATGTFNMFKSFQRSSLLLSYSRGHGFSGYVNNGETERADASYSLTLTRRMATQLGGGYESTGSALLSQQGYRVSGAYGSGRVNYQLSPSLTWFTFYTYRKQLSDDLQVFEGNRQNLVTGISWTPGVKPST